MPWSDTVVGALVWTLMATTEGNRLVLCYMVDWMYNCVGLMPTLALEVVKLVGMEIGILGIR